MGGCVGTLWDEPRLVNAGVFITDSHGKQRIYELEDHTWILPGHPDYEDFNKDIINLILKYYGPDSYRVIVRNIEDIKKKLDVTDDQIISKLF